MVEKNVNTAHAMGENEMNVVITGGSGFVGSHLVEHLLVNTDWNITVLDTLSYAGDVGKLTESIHFDPKRVRIFWHDLNAQIMSSLDRRIRSRGEIDYIINMASASHIDQSIADPVPFVRNNVNIALHMLEYARLVKPEIFYNVSCYDSETKAFTKRGILSHREITDQDEVLSLNPDTGCAEWAGIEKVIIQSYRGPMIHFKTSLSDMLVTPNHRILHQGGASGRPFQWEDAKAVADRFSAYLPTATTPVKTHQDLRYWRSYLIGVFLGDGFYTPTSKFVPNKSGLSRKEFISSRNSRGQFVAGKRGNATKTRCFGHRVFLRIPKTKRCRSKTEEALQVLGIRYSIHAQDDTIYFGGKDAAEFSIFGHRAFNKHCPRNIIDWADPVGLLDGLLDTDGAAKRPFFYSCSPALVELVIELSSRQGCSHRVTERKPSKGSYIGDRRIRQNHPQFSVSLRKQPVGIGKGKNRIIDYDGLVWCLKLKKNHNFLTIRNGISSYSGNTDEIYGSVKPGERLVEWSNINPSNAYSASKAAMDCIVIAYWRTYGVPAIIGSAMNNVGERQDREKFIPKCIWKINNGETVTIHGTPDNIGSRYYLHARNHADAILFLLRRGNVARYPEADRPDRYNIVGDVCLNNLDMAMLISKIIGKPLHYEFDHSPRSRPGHDLHYGLDGSKLAALGWKPPVPFEESLERTVHWTLKHPEW